MNQDRDVLNYGPSRLTSSVGLSFRLDHAVCLVRNSNLQKGRCLDRSKPTSVLATTGTYDSIACKISAITLGLPDAKVQPNGTDVAVLTKA